MTYRRLYKEAKLRYSEALQDKSHGHLQSYCQRFFRTGRDQVMTEAYEEALIDLGIDRNDPLTELIAKAIVNVAATGERNAPIVKERALNALGVRPRAA